MKATTIYQPWASLIAALAKPYEWRGGSYLDRRRYIGAPAHGDRIAIHASARKVKRDELAQLILDLEKEGEVGTSLVPDIALPLLKRWHTSPGMLPLSSILCTAVIGEPIRASDYAAQRGSVPADSDRIDHQKWGWPLTDIQVLEPFVPARGMQGFWTWNPSQG